MALPWAWVPRVRRRHNSRCRRRAGTTVRTDLPLSRNARGGWLCLTSTGSESDAPASAPAGARRLCSTPSLHPKADTLILSPLVAVVPTGQPSTWLPAQWRRPMSVEDKFPPASERGRQSCGRHHTRRGEGYHQSGRGSLAGVCRQVVRPAKKAKKARSGDKANDVEARSEDKAFSAACTCSPMGMLPPASKQYPCQLHPCQSSFWIAA